MTWQGLEMVRKANATVGDAPTRDDVLTNLSNVKDENLNGLLANKVSFAPGQATQYKSHPCYFVLSFNNGKATAPNGLTPTCVAS
jgi:hypothetical protein